MVLRFARVFVVSEQVNSLTAQFRMLRVYWWRQLKQFTILEQLLQEECGAGKQLRRDARTALVNTVGRFELA